MVSRLIEAEGWKKTRNRKRQFFNSACFIWLGRSRSWNTPLCSPARPLTDPSDQSTRLHIHEPAAPSSPPALPGSAIRRVVHDGINCHYLIPRLVPNSVEAILTTVVDARITFAERRPFVP